MNFFWIHLFFEKLIVVWNSDKSTLRQIDKDMEFGQTRVVSEDVVQTRYFELESNPPGNLSGWWCFWIQVFIPPFG